MAEEKKGFFSRLKEGLTKTRDNIVAGIDAVFYGASEIDDDFYEELEEILIMGDIGVNATNDIIERMKEEVKKKHLRHPFECKELLVESIKEQMRVGETAYDFEKEQSVIFIIGVNGVGKTTSVGKLAGILKKQGKKVLIAAADTFRAAAGDQLAEWAHRAGVDMIGGTDGADPASVIFDAVNAAKARNVDVLICDTAGRLHNKKNLMEELKKMNRIIDREFPNAHRENLIVLDGTTGQNALAQAREFGEVANLTGVILTKMDGTAKGGIAVAIQSELNVPVKYIGVGETIEDLQKFNADEFVNALFDVKTDEAAEEEPAMTDGLAAEETISQTAATENTALESAAQETPVTEAVEALAVESEACVQEAVGSESYKSEAVESKTFESEPFESKSSESEISVSKAAVFEDAVSDESRITGSEHAEEAVQSTITSEEGDMAMQNSEEQHEEDSPAEEAEKPKKRKWFFWK
ncbi:MAG: signal recognition particle-docking protein FtsY [Lachnospiraceae bacterium]|nr:signal recognition particle-docking protein FtsY [Lachnospiraceae bacterium]